MKNKSKIERFLHLLPHPISLISREASTLLFTTKLIGNKLLALVIDLLSKLKKCSNHLKEWTNSLLEIYKHPQVPRFSTLMRLRTLFLTKLLDTLLMFHLQTVSLNIRLIIETQVPKVKADLEATLAPSQITLWTSESLLLWWRLKSNSNSMSPLLSILSQLKSSKDRKKVMKIMMLPTSLLTTGLDSVKLFRSVIAKKTWMGLTLLWLDRMYQKKTLKLLRRSMERLILKCQMMSLIALKLRRDL